jgi:hypothetical protein
MPARIHSGCSGACKRLLDGIGIGDHIMAFEKLYRKERNLFQGLNVFLAGFQKITEFPIDAVVVILETENFQRGFFKLLLAGNTENVGCWNQGCFLAKVSKIKKAPTNRGF